jgi:glycerophosphoryl diester phosphodiesterase
VELIAHRAGNLAELVAPALTVADGVELDVHLFRNRLEVRHAKILVWPFARLWEKWHLLPPHAPRPALAEILAAMPPGTALWFDLKGYTSRLPRATHAAAGDRADATYSTRQWWLLRWVRRNTSARTMRSVGSRWQRWLVTKVRFHGPADGIVIAERLLQDGWTERLRARAPVLVAWGVADRARADELVAAGVDGLILDDLELARALRG